MITLSTILVLTYAYRRLTGRDRCWARMPDLERLFNRKEHQVAGTTG